MSGEQNADHLLLKQDAFYNATGDTLPGRYKSWLLPQGIFRKDLYMKFGDYQFDRRMRISIHDIQKCIETKTNAN